MDVTNIFQWIVPVPDDALNTHIVLTSLIVHLKKCSRRLPSRKCDVRTEYALISYLFYWYWIGLAGIFFSHSKTKLVQGLVDSTKLLATWRDATGSILDRERKPWSPTTSCCDKPPPVSEMCCREVLSKKLRVNLVHDTLTAKLFIWFWATQGTMIHIICGVWLDITLQYCLNDSLLKVPCMVTRR